MAYTCPVCRLIFQNHKDMVSHFKDNSDYSGNVSKRTEYKEMSLMEVELNISIASEASISRQCAFAEIS